MSMGQTIHLICKKQYVLGAVALNRYTFWNVSSQQAVMALIDRSFPRGVWVGKENICSPLLDLSKTLKFRAVVGGDALEYLTESISVCPVLPSALIMAQWRGSRGIIKRERYYGKRFTDRESLVKMIEDYITYYNTKRLLHNLGILTPVEKYQLYMAA